MRRLFSYLLFLACSFTILEVGAEETPALSELYCSGKSDTGQSTFLHMSKGINYTYQFDTETTSKYLMGLSCEFPTNSALLFRCVGDQNSQVYFFSQHVVEEGFDTAYGGFIKRDFLKFKISYNYVDNSGENKQAVGTRTYLFSDCSIK